MYGNDGVATPLDDISPNFHPHNLSLGLTPADPPYPLQNTDPHYEMILYCVMIAYGRRNASFLRSQKRWQPLLPLFMDHVRLDVDPEVDDHYYGVGPSSGAPRAVAVPIEAKLRSLSVRLLYEVCRIHKMSLQDLREYGEHGSHGMFADVKFRTIR